MKKIAIVADLPLWETTPAFTHRVSDWHYCVWLSPLCSALEHAQDIDVHWIISNKTIASRKVIENRNQTFHLLPKARLTIGQITGYAHDTYYIMKELAHISPDLVHCWGTENSLSWSSCWYRCKKLLSIQGLLTAYKKRARIARFERWQAFYEPSTINRFSHITTESPWAENCTREINPNAEYHHLEYAVEERFFHCRRELSDIPTCLYAGTNAPVKNIRTLIRAFEAPELAHVELHLAGITPDEYPNLPPNIKAIGRLHRDSLAQELSTAWALVHPSLADTGPTIVKEARVMGLPVMLTTQCGSQQHVEHGKSGFIVEPYDVEEMKVKVLAMTDSKRVAMEMGAYQQEVCRQKLSSETMIKNLLEIYADILN